MSEGGNKDEIIKRSAAATVRVKAKTKSKSRVTCGCPGSEPGKINTDFLAHVYGCWIRKKLLTKQFTINTSAIPSKYNDGYRLGVAKKD